MIYLLEFAFEHVSPLEGRVALIKDLQDFFAKV
jgi:hypothetical protein